MRNAALAVALLGVSSISALAALQVESAARTTDLGLTRAEVAAEAVRHGILAESDFVELTIDGHSYFGARTTVIAIALMEGEAKVHTIAITVAPVNANDQENQQALATMTGLANMVWSNAQSWTVDSSMRAWDRQAENMRTRTERWAIEETQENNAWFSLFGMPPDLMTLIITARAECRPSATVRRYQMITCLGMT